jgi:hypothetical protein
MPIRQQNATCRDTVLGKTMSQLLGSPLAALVLIDIEGEIDGAFAFAQLAELVSVELCRERPHRERS